MRLSTCLAVAASLTALALTACSGDDAATDGGADDATVDAFDLCDAFTEVGLQCPRVSPLRCFAQCEAGGCYCSNTPQGPRWTCQSDLSCVPDCAPMDDGCASVPTGDDGPGDDSTAADGGGVTDSGRETGETGLSDAGDAGDGGGD